MGKSIRDFPIFFTHITRLMNGFLPQNFNLDAHLQRYPPDLHRLPNFNRDHFVHILSLIYWIPARNKDLRERMENGYVPINKQLLQGKVHDYLPYFDYAINTGVLERDGVVIKGKKSQGYRFKPPFRQQPPVPVEYVTRAFCEGSKKSFQADVEKIRKEYNDTYDHLLRWLRPGKLAIDADTAGKVLLRRREAQLLNPALQEKKRSRRRGQPRQLKDPNDQYAYALANVEAIAQGSMFCVVDGTGGRLHTPLTTLKSELRHLLTYNGQRLVSVDIANSQPYLAAALFNVNNPKSQAGARRLPQAIKDIERQQQTKYKEEITNPLMLETLSELSEKQDVKHFMYLVGTGELYDFLKEKYTETFGEQYANKRELKSALMEVFFSSNAYRGSKTKNFFEELFPSVSRAFALIKRVDKRHLPILLQQLEAWVILERVTKRISRRNPQIPLFTIHDSIVTTKPHVDLVERLLEEELTKLTGISPTLRREEWSPESAEFTEWCQRWERVEEKGLLALV